MGSPSPRITDTVPVFKSSISRLSSVPSNSQSQSPQTLAPTPPPPPPPPPPMASDLPCDDGRCMKCQASPDETELVLCRTCATPWHVACLTSPPETLASVADWECPDCSGTAVGGGAGGAAATGGVTADLVATIREIEADPLLTEQEKAKRRQVLLSGSVAEADEDEEEEDAEKGKEEDVIDMMDHLKCSFCMQLPERPITTTCGHNFCLKCFLKWTGQGKRNCAKCRAHIPSHMASHPRINSQLVETIRIAKQAKSAKSDGSVHVYHYMHNQDRPDKAFTTERAKRAGKSNAASGQIFVTVPQDHFGPIPAENDPRRNQGVLVGESWEDRLECRQWGAHFVHVAGIAGQAEVGAQSVALSGGYEDDEDHGEWFLYTGSGGRDLGGNKRTNKHQSFDQTFTKSNEALRVSCKKGYPVRVVRSHKEKRSSYAPEKGVRYDGIYRIEKCWRKVGIQGHKVCRYLFVRCDNDPAPWTSDGHGDLPRPLPVIKELKGATDITERKESPSWDHDEKHGWKWMKPPPPSKKPVSNVIQGEVMDKRIVVRAQKKVLHEKMLKGFCCMICQEVMVDPLTTPCAHHFCKACLLDSYADKSFVVERTREGGPSLRARKITKKCPKCPTEITDFLQNPQINTGVMVLIEDLKKKVAEDAAGEDSDADEKSSAEECTATPSPPDSPSGNNATKKSPKKVKKSDDDVDVEEKSSAEKRTDVPRKSLSGSKRKVAVTKKKSAKKVRKSDRVVDAGHENIDEEDSQ